jgi:hypothetical protein
MYVSPDRRAGGDSFEHSDEVEYAAVSGQLEDSNRMCEMKILSSSNDVNNGVASRTMECRTQAIAALQGGF